MPIEIGIAAAGNRGHTYAGSYSEVDGADVVAVADVDEEAANMLADEFAVAAVYRRSRPSAPGLDPGG